MVSLAVHPPPAVTGIPLLSRGSHRSPAEGACFMEFASLLAGQRWSDHPRCTHPVVAAGARAVNDLSSDAARQRLTYHVPDVIGLCQAEPALTAALLLYFADAALTCAPRDQQLLAARGEASYRLAVNRRGGAAGRWWLQFTDRDFRPVAMAIASRAALLVAALGDEALRQLLLGAVGRYHDAAEGDPTSANFCTPLPGIAPSLINGGSHE